ncbi:molybdopterin molybdotransferase MoeA [Sediminibacterium soli]|uniref:molybdopterin molybdotransferase MoeA n=1 Tax=Sediminibacterium soli TaxID=2698829 RepID=UPI00137B0A93|nr:gephyrin-like molybdotransferase Glp [Sediminibacterium soli]NCI47695.1 molybdopterin molybdotransferase MoeA [Sediminibacterium soli]
MITVSEARQKIAQHVSALQPVSMRLPEAAGKMLARDCYAPCDIPAFPQSAMDGYAFAFEDWQPGKPMPLAGELRAGASEAIQLERGKIVRIFTGAPVPPGADTVIMQEKTETGNERVMLLDEHLLAGANVRPRASEVQAGALAMKSGTLLTPAAIGFLAGIGIAEVIVYPNPVIALVITGDELQAAGCPLQYGQVYESNSYALMAALQQLGIGDTCIYQVKDDLDALTDILQAALQQADMVLLTGGVSVGKYDFVTAAAAACGVETVFHKVQQKPGKPLYFGARQNKPVFGLPGNPSSVLTCFYLYVLEAIGIASKRRLSLPVVQAPLLDDYCKKTGLTHFLKGYYDGRNVKLLGAQESYRMQSFSEANCLVEIAAETVHCEEGNVVNLHLIEMQ